MSLVSSCQRHNRHGVSYGTKMISSQCRRLVLQGIHRHVAASGLHLWKRDFVTMSYNRYGASPTIDAPPIIVVHSLFESKVHWAGVAKLLHEHLKPERQVITVDLRNHGESEYVEEYSYEEMAADIDQLVEQLELMKIVLLGFGTGGMAAMLYARLHPSKVERLIVEDVCPFSYVDVEELTVTIRTMRNCRIPVGVPFAQASKLAETCLTKGVKNERLRTLILQNLARESNGRYVWKINLRDIETNLHNIVNFPMVGSKYRGPVLFLGSTDYHLTKPKVQERLASVVPFFPNAKVAVFPNCGHYIHLERTNDFLKVIQKFLAE